MNIFLDRIDVKYINEKVPFLIKTEWDQAGVYAKYTPTKVRVGCWSTAIAQILYYHKLIPKGKVNYKCSEGYLIKEDFDSYKFDLDLFVNKIDDNTPKKSIDQVAMYSYFTAVAIEKDFGTGLYSAIKTGWTGEDFIKYIERHYDCKVSSYSFKNNLFIQENEKVKKVVRNEINSGRPLMFFFGNQYDWGHAVVIDGFLEKGDLFLVHINQGLGGSGNGVYNLFSPIIPSYADMYRREILTIKPQK